MKTNNIEHESTAKFIEKISTSFTNGFKVAPISSLENIISNHNECVFMTDYRTNKIIYSKGFRNVLGYSDNDINLSFLLKNQHPDDSEMVNRISKATILYCMENPDNVLNNVLFISYRRRKKDGSYIKVLSESNIYEIDDNGILAKSLTKLTDISFMDASSAVSWTFEADNLNKEAFKKIIYKAYGNVFTKREKEIINEIAKGYTNKQISEKLYISKHTVVTHRKHIFKKADKHNTNDLILFCKKRGII